MKGLPQSNNVCTAMPTIMLRTNAPIKRRNSALNVETRDMCTQNAQARLRNATTAVATARPLPTAAQRGRE